MRKILISGMIGNGFEWYDFALYGQMAFIIGHLFFPSENEVAQQLSAFAAFAVAFIFRPLGAILFGWIGDKFGRKKALIIAILMMALPTGAIGLLPTYDAIGVLAPILLVVIRIMQGLSLGGEFGGAITYIVEHNEGKKRGLLGSSTIVSLIIGFLFGSFVVVMVRNSMSVEAFESWGWRVPFLLGVAIGIVGFYIRHHCEETPVYEVAKANGHISEQPIKEAFRNHWKPMLRAFGAYTAVTMPFYLVAIFFISYSKTYLKLDASDALFVNAAAMGAMLAGTILGAWMSDHYGRRKIMLIVLLIMAVLSVPVMLGMTEGNVRQAFLWQALLGFVVGIYIGPIPALLVEIFPTSVRYTGMSLAFNGATVVFGGSAPYFCIKLLEYFQTPLAIAAYVIVCCIIATIALWNYHDRWQESVA